MGLLWDSLAVGQHCVPTRANYVGSLVGQLGAGSLAATLGVHVGVYIGRNGVGCYIGQWLVGQLIGLLSHMVHIESWMLAFTYVALHNENAHT